MLGNEMSKTNTFEVDVLELILNNTPIANLGDATGPESATDGNLYVSLHTADVGEAGSQTTSEATYTGYARVAVARNPASKKWTVVSGAPTSATNAEIVQFAECTAGSNTITHFAIGKVSAGAGDALYKGALTASLAVSAGVTPRFAVGALEITED